MAGFTSAPIVWTPDRIATLRVLWDTGLSTAEIGRELGIGKNAVIGKAHRLDLTGRESPIRPPRVGPKPPTVRRAPAVTLVPPPSPVPAPLPASALTSSQGAEIRPQTAAVCASGLLVEGQGPIVELGPPATVFRPRRAAACLWTEGTRRSFVCCDQPATEGRWCTAHAARARATSVREAFKPGVRRAEAAAVVVAKSVKAPKARAERVQAPRMPLIPKAPRAPKVRVPKLAPDMTGQRFAMLVVEGRAGSTAKGLVLWKCRCDCGGARTTTGFNLRQGLVSRCKTCAAAKRTVAMQALGAARFTDHIGQRFGSLVVGERARNNTQGRTMWSCTCDCGRTHTALGQHLRSGAVTRCMSCARKASWAEQKAGAQGVEARA